ncbi:DUF5776 domain-containing protein, partial [Streptomyces sp. NPDC057927]
VEFNDKTKATDTFKIGELFTITGVEYTKAKTPRLKTKSGFYLTANASFVRKV